jgi:hypothetical protein
MGLRHVLEALHVGESYRPQPILSHYCPDRLFKIIHAQSDSNKISVQTYVDNIDQQGKSK